MTEKQTDSSGVTEAEAGGKDQEKQTVAYESYQKVLGEKKAFQAKFNELQEQFNSVMDTQKQAEANRLSEEGDYKKLLELREKEIQDFKAKVDTLSQERDGAIKENRDTWKLQAFYQELPGKIKKTEYLNFIDLDSIVFDPETREIDPASLKSTVSSFMENYSDLVDTKQFKSLPSDAPREPKAKSLNDLSREERLQLVLQKHRS